ncbi:uncharacterized protein LOC126676388 [Mercurialis annua]|uniref:uncharacterized protein LOC126676388 n=1 Tax=Mercurialis annua TaxID=3986 RepID=UPI00215F2AE5|nr:uncharacterized protein LOC126676388 [Mercurialis annua]
MDPSRISLRPFRLSDVDDFFKWFTDVKVAKNLRWNPITSTEEALSHLENIAIPNPTHYSICLHDRSIGFIAFWPGTLADDKHKASIGYAVSADYWGQGIATIALKIGLCRVFEDLANLVRVEAYTLADNGRSHRLLEKVGFVKEGLLRKWYNYRGEVRDSILYSFLSTDKIL